MSTTSIKFTFEELQQINKADDLKIAPFREDGITHGTPTWIWAVVVDGNLYVRAYNGKSSRWFQSAVQQKAGQIHAAGTVKNVSFEAASSELNDKIDAAYKAKYSGNPYLPPMISKRTKEATIKILPKIYTN